MLRGRPIDWHGGVVDPLDWHRAWSTPWLARGRGRPLDTRLSPIWVTIWSLFVIRYERRPTCRDCRKNWPLASRLSRALNHGNDTDRSAASNFLLVIHCNHGPIAYPRYTAIMVEKRKFAKTPLKRFSLQFCNDGWVEQTRMMTLKNLMILCILLDTTWRTDNETEMPLSISPRHTDRSIKILHGSDRYIRVTKINCFASKTSVKNSQKFVNFLNSRQQRNRHRET